MEQEGLVESNNMSASIKTNIVIGYKRVNLASDEEYRNVTVQEVIS